MKKQSPILTALIVIAILVVLNLLSARFSYRWDFTEENQYTLSDATLELIGELESPVTVKAYFSEDLPPDFLRSREQFKELLIEYSARSNGKVVYEFINPNKEENTEEEIIAQGIRPVMIEVREKDQKKQQKAYLSAIVEMNEEKEAIPFIQPGGSMEYNLSKAIKKLSVAEKPTIGLIQGHGEPPLEELMQVRAELAVMYNIEPYYIAGGTVPGPDRYVAMIWLRPTDSIPAAHFEFMDSYLANGGRMMVAYNPVEGDFTSMVGRAIYTGITPWLAQLGLRVEKNLVIDDRCGSVTVQQNQGMFAFANSVAFPYLPLLRGIPESDISGGLEQVMFEFPAEIRNEADTALQFEPVLQTSELSNAYKPPQTLDIQRQWTRADYKRSNVLVGASLSGSVTGDNFSRLLVFTDGDFPVNGPRQEARQVQPDNVNLFVNGIDWLVDETGLIKLRTRGVAARPLDPLDDNTKTILKYANFFLPILLVLFYGFIRSQNRRTLRKKRMQAKFSENELDS